MLKILTNLYVKKKHYEHIYKYTHYLKEWRWDTKFVLDSEYG